MIGRVVAPLHTGLMLMKAQRANNHSSISSTILLLLLLGAPRVSFDRVAGGVCVRRRARLLLCSLDDAGRGRFRGVVALAAAAAARSCLSIWAISNVTKKRLLSVYE